MSAMRIDSLSLADRLYDEAWSIAMSVSQDEALAMMEVMHARLAMLEWWARRSTGVALVLVDEQGAFERLNDQRRDNEMEIRDVRLAFRLAHTYDDGGHFLAERLLNKSVYRSAERWTREIGYATLRDLLVHDQGVNYLLACVVAFHCRSRGLGQRNWL
jgi:hypothetical protein